MTELHQGDPNSPKQDEPAPQQQKRQQQLQNLQQEGTFSSPEQPEARFIIHKGLVSLYG